MQNVEAMLCAYIEGDLDESGRAELEKLLREHPQHRKLLDELMTTRNLLRDLPHVKAPMEVDDSLRGQVERSILLNDSRTSPADQARPSRLGHSLALAAVILLCLALAMIVYRTLGPTNKPANLAINPMTPPSGAPEIPPTGSTQSEMHDELADRASTAPSFAMAAPTAAPANAPGEVQQQLVAITAPPPPANNGPQTQAVVMVLHVADPTTAIGQMSQWLHDQSDLQWSYVPASTLNGDANSGFVKSLPINDANNNNVAFDNKSNFRELKIPATQPTTMPTDAQGSLAKAAAAAPAQLQKSAVNAPPVPPSAIEGRNEFWVRGLNTDRLNSLSSGLRDQFSSNVDRFSASISGPSLPVFDTNALTSNLDTTKDLQSAASQPTELANKESEATDQRALGGRGGGEEGLGGAGGGGGGGGGGFGGGGQAFRRQNAIAADQLARSAATQPEASNTVDAIIVLAPLAGEPAQVESTATTPASQPSELLMPTTAPGN